MLKPITISLLSSMLLWATPRGRAQTNFWEPTNRPGDNEVWSLAIDPSGHIFAGTSSEGIFRSTNNGSSWRQINIGLTDSSVGALSVHAGHLFAGTWLGGIFRSTDDGDSWSSVLSENYVTDFVINSRGHIFAGLIGERSGPEGGVFLSTDSGESWRYSGLALVSGLCIDSKGNIIASGNLFPLSSGVAFGISRSTNNGASWTNVYSSSGLSGRQPFVANLKGQLFWSGETLMTSTDDGQHWAALPGNLPHAWDLCTNTSGHIFAATSRGVYRSSDDGINWSALNDGLTDTTVYSLAMDSAGYIYAGTSSGIVFRSRQSTTSVREVSATLPSAFVLTQNYPNPFNPSTTIKYELPSSSMVRLSVYDMLGREVSLLVNDGKNAGGYEVKFDGSNLASGMYIYRLQAGSFVAAKKLALVR